MALPLAAKPEKLMDFSASAVLIVEDEVFIAMDLADVVADHGARVIGPVATVAEALVLLDTVVIDGAICDAMLIDRNVTPLVLELVARGIPLVIHSATGLPSEIAASHAGLCVIRKPAAASGVVAALHDLVAARE